MLCFVSKYFIILLVLPPLFTITLLHILHLTLVSLSFVMWELFTLAANTHRTCAWISHARRANVGHIIQWRKMISSSFKFAINIEVYGDKTTQVSITVSFVLKLIGSLACMSACYWGLPKPKYEPFITHNRGTLINQQSYKAVLTQ